ncbi:hypothetical protein BDZ89DRAFT_1111596 [Hymenopellis radicata]|nr:hypothetical protein BDZ89DRAFT_1111596 [Hymenopellis radicata]
MALICTCFHACHCSPTIPYLATSIRRAFVLPSKADVTALLAKASVLQSHLTALETDMLRLRNTRTLLDMQQPNIVVLDSNWRSRLRRTLEDIRLFSQPSGVRLLPAELLEIIFQLACDSCDTFRTPLSISATCFYWRKIAISQAVIWTHIYVSADEPSTLVNLYLERSAGMPLVVKILGSRPTDIDDGHCPMNPRVAKIYGARERWRAADITLSPDEWESLNELCEGSGRFMPLLESFACGTLIDGRTRLTSPEEEEEWRLDFLDWSDLLYSATLRETTTEEMKRSLYWSQLTNVVTSFRSELDVLDMEFEREMKALHGYLYGQDSVDRRHLAIHGAIPRISPDMVITSLEIAPSVWSGNILQRISALCIPMLEELTLVFCLESILTKYFRPIYSRKKTCPFIEFLRASQCQLKTLRIFVKGINSLYTINVGDLLAILKLTPTLSRLSVIEYAPSLITDELLKMLSNGYFSPGLEELELVWSSSGADFDEALLGRMLDGRVAGALSSVVLGAREGGAVSKGILGLMETLRRRNVSARLW